MSDQLQASAHLPPAEEPRYSLDRRLGTPRRRYGQKKEKRKIRCPRRESNPGRPGRRYTNWVIPPVNHQKSMWLEQLHINEIPHTVADKLPKIGDFIIQQT
jgi:hypothetical protein